MGIRAGSVHTSPSVDVLMTRSFDLQPRRNRQSDHTTYTLPAASISAVGSGPLRKPPAVLWSRIRAIVIGPVHDAPPFVDLKARTAFSNALSIGITTVPSGCTTGWPPITPCRGNTPCVHVRPPFRENATCT